MKKSILAIMMLFCAFITTNTDNHLLCASAETKTFYFTRHGQRGDPKYQRKFKNCDEDALMPKGEEQAAHLGKYLNQKGFNGTIYVSPYYRTLQTATIAANQMKEMPMVIEPRCQEVSHLKNSSGKPYRVKNCITKKELKDIFPSIKIPRGMKFPWRLENEREDQKDLRIGKMIDDIAKTSGDAFIVCHGGIMASVVREMNKRGASFPRKKCYNCCLYSFTMDTETGRIISFSDETLNYLPNDLITDNLAYMLILPERK